jgi:hypothetical protein
LLGRTHGRGGDLLVHDRLGFSIFEVEIEFLGSRAPVERGNDDPGELARPVDGRRFPAVLQHGHEVVAGFESERVEAGNERRDFVVPGAVAQPDIPVDDRQRLGITRDACEEARAEIKHRGALSGSIGPRAHRTPRPPRPCSGGVHGARVGRASRQ